MTHIAKLIDLRTDPAFNSINAPFGHLGVSRSAMPQIDHTYRSDFINWLRKNDIKVQNIRVPIKSLKMSQSEYDRDKVMEIMDSMRKGGSRKFDPLFVSSDGYIVDGNHRFLAKFNLDDTRYMDVTEIGKPMMELLDAVKAYPHARYRNLHDKPM